MYVLMAPVPAVFPLYPAAVFPMQGSVLGPLHFITYINDVATCISPGSNVNMFADDIALYRIIKTATDYRLHPSPGGC